MRHTHTPAKLAHTHTHGVALELFFLSYTICFQLPLKCVSAVCNALYLFILIARLTYLQNKIVEAIKTILY